MNNILSPEVVRQVQEIAAYAREKGYAEVVITPSGNASFKRGDLTFMTKRFWRSPGMTIIRFLAFLWIVLMVICAYAAVALSALTPLFHLDFGWMVILLAAPWLGVVAVMGTLFVEGVESKYLISQAFFIGVLMIGLGSIAPKNSVKVLLYTMGIPLLVLAYLPDMQRAMAKLLRIFSSKKIIPKH